MKANVKRWRTRGRSPSNRGRAGLYLHVADNSARWLFRYHRNGRPTETGLGSARDVTLKEAVERAQELRKAVRSGTDPIEQKRQQKLQARTDSVNGTTLGDVIDAYRKAKGEARGVKVTAALIDRHAAQLLPVAAIDIDAGRS